MAKKIVRLTENEMTKLVRKIINEEGSSFYDDTVDGFVKFMKEVKGQSYITPNEVKYDTTKKTYQYGYKKYMYKNGRFEEATGWNQDRMPEQDQIATEVRRTFAKRVTDRESLDKLYSFIRRISRATDKGREWDRNRRDLQLDNFIPTWEEYQALQRLA